MGFNSGFKGLIENKWLKKFMDREDKKVTSYNLTKCGNTAAYLDTRYCCFYRRGCERDNG